MIEKHYKSDFKVFVSLPDKLTLAPFKFTYFIEGNRTKYVVSYDGHSYYNCSPLEDGRLLIVFQNHNLGIGTINVIRQYFLPDEDFASGVCRTFSEESTDIYLGEGYSDEGDVNVQLPPNYMQGKPGKSAYQEWLDLGNTGTVQDYLNSMKGKTGGKGDKGDKGNDGRSFSYADMTDEQKKEIADMAKPEIVDNLEDGGIDKALSAEMGVYLKQLINGVVSGDSIEAVKFKGYVNIESKDAIEAMFDQLKEGEACLVAPSVDAGNGDSFKAWVASALNDETIPINEELFKTEHNITAANIVLGRLEVKTYLKLDEAQPYCKCPDMILLCKVRVKAKDFIEFVGDISDTVISMIPSSLMLTACIGKVLRWSAGDWLLNNPDKYSLTHKYGYNTDIDTALELGIIGYTATCTSGMPGGITENYTVIINASSDSDPNFRTIQQIAYGRTGAATNRVWTRILFKNVKGGVDNFLPWVEISNDKNILPNVNGWLLNPDEQLATGVYQTCNSFVVQSNDSYPFHNNYFTMFVNASTSPNGDGWDAIEQTAYGREADEGKIYRRVIFLNKTTNETQYKEWKRIDDGGSITEGRVEEMIANSITNALNTEV